MAFGRRQFLLTLWEDFGEVEGAELQIKIATAAEFPNIVVMVEEEYGGSTEVLPPPPPVPLDFSPEKAEPGMVKKMCGLGRKGQHIRILNNHFKVNVSNVDGHFFHYSVALFYEDGQPVEVKGIGRKVLERVHETYHTEMAGKDFAYDGEKSLFTIGSLPRSKFEFTVVLNDKIFI
ncbi:hypothetical protein KY290_017295 [Solanum tuberosum]|uniref:Protein argonaute N-terminal domain-containing protein n=1 Tax=Solanum tuberosum TaxID=4113 RepID=A0ABQ7VAW4_SOLTU|nr:hypothetical protein KY284_016312 [Solanum tuberosum]KAH0761222.1 hypothetical protein KY290_017295 [Solanum tuberosum]